MNIVYSCRSIVLLLLLGLYSRAAALPSLYVKDYTGVNRSGIINNGIPLSKADNVLDLSQYHIQTAGGTPVDCQLEALWRWGGAVI